MMPEIKMCPECEVEMEEKRYRGRYGNFRDSQRKERTPPFESKIIGLKKIILTDTGYKENWL